MMTIRNSHRNIIILILIVIISVWWRSANLDAFGTFNDEGTYLMWAKHQYMGHSLYSDTKAVQGPFFISAITASFLIGGISVESARWLTIFWSVITLLGIAWLAKIITNWQTALIAMVLLSINPFFFTFSRSVHADVPAIALTLLAIGLALHYQQHGHCSSLIGVGVMISISWLVKALYPLLPFVIIVIIMQRYIPAFVKDILLISIGFFIPMIFAFTFWDSHGLYDAMVTFRLDLRQAHPLSISQNATQLMTYIGDNLELVLLAILGTISLFRSHNLQSYKLAIGNCGYGYWILLWLFVTIITLLSHTPLFEQHLLAILPPIVLLASIALWQSITGLFTWQKSKMNEKVFTAIGACFIGMYLLSLPNMVKTNNTTRDVRTGGREAEAINFLKTVTRHDDNLISDNQLLIFMAERQAPPQLGDIAQVAINAGRQNSRNLISLSESYSVQAVASWSLRLIWLTEYEAWLDDNFLTKRVWDGHHIIYFGRRFPKNNPIPNEQHVQLGDSIIWKGFHVDTETPFQGETLPMTFYWQAKHKPHQDYTIFTQILNSHGQLVTSWDAQPLHGYLPTTSWQVAEIITDRVDVPLPDDLPSDIYTIIIGMYDLATLERLPIFDSEQDFIVVLEIRN